MSIGYRISFPNSIPALIHTCTPHPTPSPDVVASDPFEITISTSDSYTYMYACTRTYLYIHVHIYRCYQHECEKNLQLTRLRFSYVYHRTTIVSAKWPNRTTFVISYRDSFINKT